MGIIAQASPCEVQGNFASLKRRPSSDVFNTAFYEFDQEAESTDTEHNELESELAASVALNSFTCLTRRCSSKQARFDGTVELQKLDEIISRHPVVLGVLVPLLIKLLIIFLLVVLFSTSGFADRTHQLMAKFVRSIFLLISSNLY